MPDISKVIKFATELAKRKVRQTPKLLDRNLRIRALQEAIDEAAAVHALPQEASEGIFKRFRSMLDEAGIDREKADSIMEHVRSYQGSDAFSSFPYEDIDITLKDISGYPSLGVQDAAKEAQRILRRKKLIRAGQGAEHPDLYGEWGHPDAID